MKLSKREKEILSLLYLPNKKIAQGLNITVATVKTHIHHLYDKFPLSDTRTSLFYHALNEGVIKLDFKRE